MLYQARVLSWGKEKQHYFARKQALRFALLDCEPKVSQ